MNLQSLFWRSVMACAGVWATSACASAPPAPHVPPPPARDVLARVPLSFEVNQGQADGSVKFVSRGPGHMLLLSDDHAALQLIQANQRPAVRMKLRGGNTDSRIEPAEPQPGQVNYLIGNDPSQWQIDVPHYARVRYREVYPGVDLVFYGNQQQLEYDFVVSPGVDPAAIAIAFDGANRLELNARGDLVVDAHGGRMVQTKPIVYQEIDGRRTYVDGQFVLKSSTEVGFEVAAYDSGRALVIDPPVLFTYHGGGNDDIGLTVATDDTGNIYMGGSTAATNFPTMGPAQGTSGGRTDAWVTKFGPGGTMIYSTYAGGSGDDIITGITVGGRAGNAYVTGSTSSPNFPTFIPIQSANAGGVDAFVAELNTAGNGFVFSTYAGGRGEDRATGLTLDADANIFFTGFTASDNFPTVNPFQPTYGGGPLDAFVTKINPAGTQFTRSTYLGGAQIDQGMAIAWDLIEKKLGVTGHTTSTNFPTTPGAYQSTAKALAEMYLALINSDLTPTSSTYIGGNGVDQAFGIAFGPNGLVGLTGKTSSTDFPLVSPYQPAFGGGDSDALMFLMRSSNGSPLVPTYSTYLGGSGADAGYGIAFDSTGSAVITGGTSSRNLPVLNPEQPAFGGGPDDVFFVGWNGLDGGPRPPEVFSYFGGPGADAGCSVVLENPIPGVRRFVISGRSVEGSSNKAFLTVLQMNGPR